MELLLLRTYFPGGTNGYIYKGASRICSTIELPWLNNKPGVSCIPEGRYRLLMRYSLKFKTHIILKDVENRALILIHPANNAVKELKGCIAPVEKITGEGKGSASRIAFKKLMNLIGSALAGGPVFLTIKNKKYDNKRKGQTTHTTIL